MALRNCTGVCLHALVQHATGKWKSSLEQERFRETGQCTVHWWFSLPAATSASTCDHKTGFASNKRLLVASNYGGAIPPWIVCGIPAGQTQAYASMRLYSTQPASENLRWNRKGSEKQGNALYIDDSLYLLPQVPPYVTAHTTTKHLLQTSVFLWHLIMGGGQSLPANSEKRELLHPSRDQPSPAWSFNSPKVSQSLLLHFLLKDRGIDSYHGQVCLQQAFFWCQWFLCALLCALLLRLQLIRLKSHCPQKLWVMETTHYLMLHTGASLDQFRADWFSQKTGMLDIWLGTAPKKKAQTWKKESIQKDTSNATETIWQLSTSTGVTFPWWIFLKHRQISLVSRKLTTFVQEKTDTVGHPRVRLAFFTTSVLRRSLWGATLISPDVDTSMLLAHPILIVLAGENSRAMGCLSGRIAASEGTNKFSQRSTTLFENWSKSLRVMQEEKEAKINSSLFIMCSPTHLSMWSFKWNSTPQARPSTPQQHLVAGHPAASTWDPFFRWLLVTKNTMWVFPKIGYPPIIHFNRVFHYKPSILGYHNFWKHPCDCIFQYF